MQISNVLPRGHQQTLPCWEAQNPHQARCTALVEYTMDRCRHVIKIKRYRMGNPGTISCSAVCDASLPCGHGCKRVCYICRVVGANKKLPITKVNADSVGYGPTGRANTIGTRPAMAFVLVDYVKPPAMYAVLTLRERRSVANLAEPARKTAAPYNARTNDVRCLAPSLATGSNA